MVVARFRRHVAVESSSGTQSLCVIRGRTLKPLVGDDVLVERNDDGTRFIAGLMPRRTTLTRIDSRGACEAVAANVTQLLIVAAAEPPPDPFLIDRYLVAAELMGAKAAVIVNKGDLLETEPALVGQYRAIGYPALVTSVTSGAGLEALAAAMAGERSVMVGQSGVGKSSLGNALLGADARATGELTAKGRQGRHTTTTASLSRLPNAGELIDSPGVRGYAPYIETGNDVAYGFRELRAHAGRCRFDDCAHRAEPGCAIKAAVEAGAIAAARYASYAQLRALVESLRLR